MLVRAVELLVAAHVHQLFQVADVDARAAHLFGLLQRALESKDLVDGFQDVGAQAQQGFDREVGGMLDVVNRRLVVRVHHGDREAPAVELDGHHEVLQRERFGNDGSELPGVELERIDARERNVCRFRKRAAQLLLVEEFAARIAAGEAEAGNDLERRDEAALGQAALAELTRHHGAPGGAVALKPHRLLHGEELALEQQVDRPSEVERFLSLCRCAHESLAGSGSKSATRPGILRHAQ